LVQRVITQTCKMNLHKVGRLLAGVEWPADGER